MGPKAIVVGTPRKVSFGVEPWNRRTSGPVWALRWPAGLAGSIICTAATASPFDGATVPTLSKNNTVKWEMGRCLDWLLVGGVLFAVLWASLGPGYLFPISALAGIVLHLARVSLGGSLGL
jgi:hypothetical protein